MVYQQVKEYESSKDLDGLVRLRMILMPEVGT